MRNAPASRTLNTGEKHWEIFVRLCHEIKASGDDVPDVYLAALAVENRCELISTDAGFGRFAGLKWRKPF
jgi:predicted nucleic acid-binding protein